MDNKLPVLKVSFGKDKARVGQPIPERIQRLALKIAVGAALNGIVLKGREVVHRAVEGHRQLARRADLPERDLRKRRAARLAGIPGKEDRVALLDPHRAARCDHGDHGLPGGNHRVDQAPLAIRKLQADFVARGEGVAGIALFALNRCVQPNAQEHGVRVCRAGRRLRQPVVRQGEGLNPVLVKMAPLRVQNAHALRRTGLADAFEEGHIPRGCPVVVALERQNAVRVGPDDRDCF